MNDQNKMKLSSEFLNAFVDGQLDAEEKNRAFIEVGRDEAMNREVCELRKLHELVQFAYADATPPSSRNTPGGRNHWLGMSAAASFAMAIGMVIGWVLHTPPTMVTAKTVPVATPVAALAAVKTAPAIAMPVESKRAVANSDAVALAPTVTVAKSVDSIAHLATAITGVATTPVAVADATTDEKIKILIHVNRSSASEHTTALNDIEMLVRHYREQGQSARIEVVVNGEGLNMLRSDVTAQAERIHKMQQDYGNLTFAACQNTIDRLRREQGVRAQLLPGVIVIDSGVAQIMRRQHQGWAYIRV